MNSIESILGQNLTPVAAPEELWARVNRGPVRRTDRRAAWVLAVAVVVAGLAWSLGKPEALRSSEPAAVRAWVISRTGMDIPLAGGDLTGVRMRRGVVEVTYRGGTLMVARASSAGDASHGARAASWTRGGQVFTLQGDLEAGCKLCHAEGMLN